MSYYSCNLSNILFNINMNRENKEIINKQSATRERRSNDGRQYLALWQNEMTQSATIVHE